MSCSALLSVALVLTPAGAGARQVGHHYGQRSYGATALVLNAGTAATLTTPAPGGLGLSVAPIAPAYVSNGAIEFPITNGPLNALLTGNVYHSGGIAISSATSTVDLTNFDINAWAKTLTADVSVVSGGSTSSLGAVDIVSLDLSGARLSFGFGGLSLGPVQATLNTTALSALGGVFGVPALGTSITSLPLGTATIQYHGWFF
jgi:hypothetical protein